MPLSLFGQVQAILLDVGHHQEHAQIQKYDSHLRIPRKYKSQDNLSAEDINETDLIIVDRAVR